jgi:hypothetical protein
VGGGGALEPWASSENPRKFWENPELAVESWGHLVKRTGTLRDHSLRVSWSLLFPYEVPGSGHFICVINLGWHASMLDLYDRE